MFQKISSIKWTVVHNSIGVHDLPKD